MWRRRTCRAVRNIQLREDGYTYSPYVVLTRVGPFSLHLHCTDANLIDGEGLIHDRMDMRWLGLLVAVLTMTIRVDRSERVVGSGPEASVPD